MHTVQRDKNGRWVAVSSIVWDVLGSFSKGIATARTLNFGISGGENCATSCRHHPEHYQDGAPRDGACYAWVVEKRADRQQLADKLERHENLPASIVTGKALVELSRAVLHGKTVGWLRISTNGAVPQPAEALADRRFLPLLREFLQTANRAGIPVHFPVESAEKAAFYRQHVGDLVTIRESIQTHNMEPSTIAGHDIPAGACSFTAGEDVGAGPHKRARILAAAVAAAAAWAQRTGRKTIVCPAVRVSFLARTKAGRGSRTAEQVAEWRAGAKCGACTACALAHIDVVYPAH
jgi:hypothetical protein